jgi:hypothetical protein
VCAADRVRFAAALRRLETHRRRICFFFPFFEFAFEFALELARHSERSEESLGRTFFTFLNSFPNLLLNLPLNLLLHSLLNLVSSRASRDLLFLFVFEFAPELARHSERLCLCRQGDVVVADGARCAMASRH